MAITEWERARGFGSTLTSGHDTPTTIHRLFQDPRLPLALRTMRERRPVSSFSAGSQPAPTRASFVISILAIRKKCLGKTRATRRRLFCPARSTTRPWRFELEAARKERKRGNHQAIPLLRCRIIASTAMHESQPINMRAWINHEKKPRRGDGSASGGGGEDEVFSPSKSLFNLFSSLCHDLLPIDERSIEPRLDFLRVCSRSKQIKWENMNLNDITTNYLPEMHQRDKRFKCNNMT